MRTVGDRSPVSRVMIELFVQGRNASIVHVLRCRDGCVSQGRTM
jgi:hypothetical protein